MPKTINVDTVNTATWTAKTLPFTTTSFNLIDISTTGTALALADDGEADIRATVLVHAVRTTSSDLRMTKNNGGILYGITTGDLGTTDPAPAQRDDWPGRSFPFWDDIDSDTGDVYWEVQGLAPNRVAIIKWYHDPATLRRHRLGDLRGAAGRGSRSRSSSISTPILATLSINTSMSLTVGL